MFDNVKSEQDWRLFLKKWDQELREAESYISDRCGVGLTDMESDGSKVRSGLITYAGATGQQLSEAEERLDTSLPPSYRNLLKASNGFRPVGFGFEKFHSSESVEWFVTGYDYWINAYLEGTEDLALPTVPDDRYFVYGAAQSACPTRVEYLEGCLEITPPSLVHQDHIFLLNPAIKTGNGEWEAWSFANWKAGATRYKCLWDMLSDERRLFTEKVAELKAGVL